MWFSGYSNDMRQNWFKCPIYNWLKQPNPPEATQYLRDNIVTIVKNGNDYQAKILWEIVDREKICGDENKVLASEDKVREIYEVIKEKIYSVNALWEYLPEDIKDAEFKRVFDETIIDRSDFDPRSFNRIIELTAPKTIKSHIPEIADSLVGMISKLTTNSDNSEVFAHRKIDRIIYGNELCKLFEILSPDEIGSFVSSMQEATNNYENPSYMNQLIVGIISENIDQISNISKDTFELLKKDNILTSVWEKFSPTEQRKYFQDALKSCSGSYNILVNTDPKVQEENYEYIKSAFYHYKTSLYLHKRMDILMPLYGINSMTHIHENDYLNMTLEHPNMVFTVVDINHLERFLSNMKKYNDYIQLTPLGQDNSVALYYMNIKNVNKAYAILELLLHVSFSEEDLIVVGDSIKDVEMLQLHGDTAAMVNGEREAKEAAKEITEFDNNHDGAVKYINKILGLDI